MTNGHELTRYFNQLTAADKFSGVVLITQGDSEVYSRAFGYASRTWRARNSLQTRFDTASITKPFTAVAVLQLINRQLIALDTPVVEYLGLSATGLSQAITVFHLLTHSSGIGDDADEEAGEKYEDLWKSKPNYSVTETAHFLPQFIDKPANFEPGQGCRYCNCGYVLLGLVIEKATGMSYRDYVQTEIFPRAGMGSSAFLRMDRVEKNVAEGCDPILNDTGQITGWKRNIYSFPPVGSPDAGAHVTVGDLDRFLRAVKGGKLLSPELTKAFFTPKVAHGPMTGGIRKYGFGLWFCVDEADHVLFCEKEGINAGVSGRIRHYPDQDVNVVLLCNMEQAAWAPMKQVHEWVIAGFPS